METTQQGVSAPVSSEAQFQSLFDAGAFDPNKPTQAEPAQAAQQAAQPDPAPQAQEAAQNEPVADDDGPEYASLADFLKAQKVDPESFQSLPVTVKIDGEEKLIPLADVIKSYQLEGHVNNKSIQLSEAQKQFEAERQAAISLYQQQLQNARALSQIAAHDLLQEYQQINWQKLQAEDPLRFIMERQKFQDRQTAINAQMQQITEAQEAERQQLQQQQAANLPKEREKMLAARPEWRDPAKFEADRKVMTAYAKQIGFSDAEIAIVSDHRYMQVLADAAQFRALQAANPETLKRVRAAPAMSRPGTRTNRDPAQVAKQQAIERFNKNPRDLSAQEALFESLSG